MNIKKKKILFIIPGLGYGGAERVLIHLINHLSKEKYSILLVLFEDILDYQRELCQSIEIRCLDKKSRWDFFSLVFKLRNIYYSFKPDIVISFLHYTNIITILASYFLKKKFTLIISERSNPRKYLPRIRCGHIKKWLMRLTYNKADKIISVSEGVERVLNEDFNISPDKIKSIYNPISIGAISVRSQEEVKHPFFSDKNAQIIISVGRLVDEKRFDRLLKAFSLLSKMEKNKKNVYLIILGEGILRRELEILASKLNINKCVDFVGFKSNPYAWIAKADIFVLSSDFEGLPNVVIEAMACGTPVISTDCASGPNELITNGKNGILVPTVDENALAEAMETLLRNENLRKKFSKRGRKRAEDFRIKKIIPQYEELF